MADGLALAAAGVEEVAKDLSTPLAVFHLGVELHAPDRPRRVGHRLDRANGRVGEYLPAGRGDDDLVVVARPDPQLPWQVDEHGMLGSVDRKIDRPEFGGRGPPDAPSERAGEELVSDADREDRHGDGPDPLVDPPERGGAALEAERSAREDDPVGVQLVERHGVRDDPRLGPEVAQDAPLAVGPLAAVVENRDLHVRPPVRRSGSAVDSAGSRPSLASIRPTDSRTVEISCRIFSISSSNGVNPDGLMMRWVT